MAAYAALVSVMHIIDQIEHHPHPPISLDEEKVKSLTEKVTFLKEFLEVYSHVAGHSNEADPLESRIADAAYAAEDIIESHIVYQILDGSTSHGEKIDFYQELQKVIEEMDLIKKEVTEIKDKVGVQDQQPRESPIYTSSFGSASIGYNSTMVGFDDVLLELMDKLTGGQLDRHIIPIVGMAGIGKTTLARNIYAKPLIKEHFDICAWATVSQEYDTQEILRDILCQGNKEGMRDSSESVLGETLYKHLSGRRYLIVIDDLWDIDAWDKIKFFFPNYSNGSRIVVTTRLSNLAFQLTDSYSLGMKFLDEDKCWDLFCKTVFGEEDCPIELEKTGKKIVKNCKGLPLSIIVIGGLLVKSKHMSEYWEYIGENLNSIVNSDDNEGCLKILHMSYNQLPVYLKPCFLYMGVFKEDSAIRVSMLIKLWVAEGFLKPISSKSLEEIAKEYLKELIDRNLILVHELGCTGNIKYCNIHDLLRDLCLREAKKERFYNAIRQHSLKAPQDTNTLRRIVVPDQYSTSQEKVLDHLQSMSLARSLIWDSAKVVLPVVGFRLLRIFKAMNKNSYRADKYFLEDIFRLVNSRLLAVIGHLDTKFPSSIYLLWNLHTLIVEHDLMSYIAPADIWNMPQLRHVIFKKGLYLPDPPSGNFSRRDDIVLWNLQTLMIVKNFNFVEEVVKRIPNIKKLKVTYEDSKSESDHLPNYCLNNFERLHKLESFECSLSRFGIGILRNLSFPHSLKNLSLEANYVHYWEDILEKIGLLPLLQKLTLRYGPFRTHKWETVEGQFPSLRVLRIQRCSQFKYWTTESSHFPRLEHLELGVLDELEEIPSEIGEIPTLKSIELMYCSDSAIISAKKIVEEQEELHGEVGFRVRVILSGLEKIEAGEMFTHPNFQVERW